MSTDSSPHLDKVAEAICGATSSGQLFPWSEATEQEREAWRRMAQAAMDALQLTEETAFQHHFPNGRSVLLTDLTDIKTARKVAAQAGMELTEVFRLASPWIEDQ